jgi:hypothetical protein
MRHLTGTAPWSQCPGRESKAPPALRVEYFQLYSCYNQKRAVWVTNLYSGSPWQMPPRWQTAGRQGGVSRPSRARWYSSQG